MTAYGYSEDPQDITLAYVQNAVAERLGDRGPEAKALHWTPMRHQGTSGARLQRIELEMTGADRRLRLILKIGGSKQETLFYQHIAGRLPIQTPHVFDARFLSDGTAWILMEEISGAKSGLDWTVGDYRMVISDMAEFHASNWGDPNGFREADWIAQTNPQTIAQRIGLVGESLWAVGRSWIPESIPDVFNRRRLELMELVLGRSQLLDPLLDFGCTLVHGDYWFHNVLITADGRRVLIDWDSCSLWSGLWELAYFLNLLKAIGPGVWRDALPITESDAMSWYLQTLQEHGVRIAPDDFAQGMVIARIWQPLAHWLHQLAQVAPQPASVLSEATVRFLDTTFSRWEQDARSIL